MKSVILAILFMSLTACGNNSSSTDQENVSKTTDSISRPEHPGFNEDSAYNYIAQQVAFGHRIPGSDSHKKCSEYLVSELSRHGADTVTVQRGSMKAFDGNILPIANIMARFNSDASRRILIAAHYDTRPWADSESSVADRQKPILGANDGGSGVAVILELARNIGLQHPEIGVDFLLTDAEDYGTNEGFGYREDSWCLGTQYWAEHNPYTTADRPAFGIVLDMVGGRNAKFHREHTSNRIAPHIVDKVWGTAAHSPYADRFINETGGSIVDDHVYINTTGIPCIDIIECYNASTRSFPPTWHTLDDNLANIDRSSLKAVGEVMMDVIYNEKKSQ